MGAIYQSTFFLATALLAIAITVFVFAVSLLGRAIEVAAKSERDKLTERKENNKKEMADIKKEIEEAEATGQIPMGLTRRKLAKLEKQDKKFGKEQGRIRKAPALLTVRGGVFYPGAFLVAALVLSSAAWYLSNIKDINWAKPLFIWILGLVAIGYGIYRICKSLNVIQSVAIPSEEVAFKRETEAFKVALRDFEEEKKPVLELGFRRQKQPPFHIKVDSEIKLEFFVVLRKGDVAESVFVLFHVPPGFSFPGRQSTTQEPDHHTIPNFLTAHVDYPGLITRGVNMLNDLVIKAPPKAGSFSGYYCVMCRGFTGESEKFEIVVEESDIPSAN